MAGTVKIVSRTGRIVERLYLVSVCQGCAARMISPGKTTVYDALDPLRRRATAPMAASAAPNRGAAGGSGTALG